MPSVSRSLNSAVRWHVWWNNCGVFAAIILLFWLLVGASFVANYFGFELKTKRGSAISPRVAIIMASVVSVLALLLAVPRYFKAIRLAKVGKPILGTVREKLGVTLQSLETYAISYFVNDKPYRIKAGLGSEENIGTKVSLIFDPNRPQRCLPRDRIFPSGYDVEM